MNQDAAKLLEEKKKRVSITLQNGKADKIPFIMWRSDYLIYYYGSQMADIDSYDKMIDILRRGSEELKFDICDAMDPIRLSYVPREKIFGGTMYKVSDDLNSVQINPEKIRIMEQSDYPAFIEDPINTLLEVILPRRLDILKERDVAKKYEAFEQSDALGVASGEFRKRCVDELGLLGSSHHFFTMPVDTLFDFLRDFSGITRDIRTCPDEVAAAADVLADYIIEDMAKAPVLDYSTTTAALHLPPFIKPKDFEKVYWPSFRKIIEFSYSKGMVCKLLFEKSWSHLFDFLDELPKNSVLGYFERDDDFRTVYKRFGDKMIIAGGIETNLLARGTKEQCVDSVKAIIDDTCGSGGVMLTSDMPMVYKRDAIPENFKAVADTIYEYGRY